jgi:hypothetical protein
MLRLGYMLSEFNHLSPLKSSEVLVGNWAIVNTLSKAGVFWGSKGCITLGRDDRQMHWLGWLFDYLMVIGFASHLSEPFVRAWHEENWGGVFIGVGMAALTIGHFGRSETTRLGRLLAQLGGWIRSAGNYVQDLPDRVNAKLNPAVEASTLYRRHREVKSNRRTRAFLTVCLMSFIAFYLGIFVYGLINPRVPGQPQISDVRPPPAPQPFDKRWEAPAEKEGTGGSPTDEREIAPSQDDSLLPRIAPVPKPRPERSHPAAGQHIMKDPWNFPRL